MGCMTGVGTVRVGPGRGLPRECRYRDCQQLALECFHTRSWVGASVSESRLLCVGRAHARCCRFSCCRMVGEGSVMSVDAWWPAGLSHPKIYVAVNAQRLRAQVARATRCVAGGGFGGWGREGQCPSPTLTWPCFSWRHSMAQEGLQASSFKQGRSAGHETGLAVHPRAPPPPSSTQDHSHQTPCLKPVPQRRECVADRECPATALDTGSKAAVHTGVGSAPGAEPGFRAGSGHGLRHSTRRGLRVPRSKARRSPAAAGCGFERFAAGGRAGLAAAAQARPAGAAPAGLGSTAPRHSGVIFVTRDHFAGPLSPLTHLYA